MTRVVCISDTHNQHAKIEIPEGDILIHAGDATDIGSYNAVEKFLHWMEWLPHPHKIFIAGNHDLLFEDDPSLCQQLLGDVLEITYLQDSSVEVEGLKIWGSPWTPRFFDWAFNVDMLDLYKKWEEIPADTDIVITHGPPYGVGDKAPRQNGMGFEHVGCPDLLRKIKEIQPKLHVFGHIHEGHGVWDDEGKLWHLGERKSAMFVNASSLDGRYRKIHKPIVVDL